MRIGSALCLPAVLAVSVGCGSGGSDSGGGANTTAGAAGSAGALGAAGASVSVGGASTAGSGGAGANTAGASAAGSTNGGAAGTASGGQSGGGTTGSSGGSAGSSGGNAGAAGTTTAPRDYPYCDYGNVPSASAPAPWNDTPTLTPIALHPFGAPALTIPGGYLLLNEGPQGTTQVPHATQASILARINDDLKFEISYSYIHLPPWVTGAKGTHYIDYMFVNTGLPKDPNAGGDQGTEGQYPDVETTSIAMNDPSQRYDVTHEFNHVLQSSYNTFPGNRVSWIHESYNDYLILLTVEHALGTTPGQSAQFTLPNNVSYLDILTYQQNFAPIESCGVAVKDGSSVTGPADFPNDITGFRYNDLFPLFIAQRVGQHFFADVWEQANGKEQVLQVMTRLLDQPRVSCLVGEYSARLAVGDFGEFSTSIQHIANDPAMYTTVAAQDRARLPRNGRLRGVRRARQHWHRDRRAQQASKEQCGHRRDHQHHLYGLQNRPKYGWDLNETFGYKLQVSGGTTPTAKKTYF